MQTAQHALHARVEDRHWWFTGRRRILRLLVDRMAPAGEGVTIVDVGCGTGANLAALAPGRHARGLDASADAVRLARERFPGLELACADDPLERRDWLAEADVVLLTDVIEHVEDDFLLLSRVLSAMRPGAQLLLTVPADMRLWGPHDEAFGHWRRYDVARLRATWEGLAVRERMLSAFNARLVPLIGLSRALSRRLGRAPGLAGTDFRMPPAPLNRLLAGVFAGECARLLAALEGGPGYRAGASLLAVLQRGEGRLEPRERPADLDPGRRPTPTGT